MRSFVNKYGLILALVLVLAVPAIAETVATLGRADSSGNYAFTVDDIGSSL